MTDRKEFDVIIIGGSYSGLSAAMALGRSMRNVLIIDNELPCNRQTPHSHNFLTQDGAKPSEIRATAKTEVLKYSTVKFHIGFAQSGRKIDKTFEITTREGEVFKCEKLILSTGIKDLMPNIKGFSECWGISIVHCPYCHGYEYRNRNTGILINGDKAFHIASLVNNLTDKITLLSNGKATFTKEQMERLKHHNIKIIEKPVVEMEHDNGIVKNVIFNDGTKLNFDAIYASLPFEQQTNIPIMLGCELTDQGYIKVDNSQKTSIEGVFACGDNTNMMRSVANAVATGSLAGAMINKELTDERF